MKKYIKEIDQIGEQIKIMEEQMRNDYEYLAKNDFCYILIIRGIHLSQKNIIQKSI